MSNIAQKLIGQTDRYIKNYGNPVTLATLDSNGNPVVANGLYLTKEDQIQKYVVRDGGLEGRGKMIAVFIFSGSLLGSIESGDVLTFNGVKWVVTTPLYPAMVSGLCTRLAVACFTP